MLILIFVTPESVQSSQHVNDVTKVESLPDTFFKTNNTPVPIPSADELSSYTIDVDFSPNLHSATGWANISYLNTENIALNEVYFHLWPNALLLNGLQIHQLVANNNEDLAFQIEEEVNLKVSLPVAVGPGSRASINIYFTTTLPNINSRFGYVSSPHELYVFGNWHPVLSVYENEIWNKNPYVFFGEGFYTDMAYYNVSISSPADQVIAAAADFISTTSSSNTTLRHKWTAGPVRDFTWIASPDYQVSSIQHNNVQISSYYFPEHLERGILALNITINSLEIFSELFEPWPYDTMVIAEIDAWFSGMEYNQLIMIAEHRYNTSISEIGFFEDVISHEWAHSWNTYLVANNPYEAPWLDEAWASYASVLYFEFIYVDQDISLESLYTWKNNYLQYVVNNSDQPLGLGMNFYDLNPDYGLVYTKGATFIGLLRSILGDELFFDTTEAFYEEFTYKTVTTEQFINFFEAHSGQELSWLFDQYVVQGLAPLAYEIIAANYKNDSVNENWIITVSVRQNHISQPSIMRVPIEIGFNTGITVADQVWINTTTETFEVLVPISNGTPTHIELDPEWILIRENTQIKKNLTYNPSLPIASTPINTNSILLSFFVLLIAFSIKRKSSR